MVIDGVGSYSIRKQCPMNQWFLLAGIELLRVSSVDAMRRAKEVFLSGVDACLRVE
jgi:hypothetical protein